MTNHEFVAWKRTRSWTRGLLALFTAAVLATVITPSAAASPAVASAAAPAEATIEEKIAAASALGITPTNELLIRPDRYFVAEIWRLATGDEVRLAAAGAFAGSDADCTRFIRTDVYPANDRDILAREKKAAVEREAHAARSRAAAALFVVATNDMFVVTEKDFVFRIWELSGGWPKARAAARAAYFGTSEQQAAFVRTGIFDTSAQDKIDKIEAQEEIDLAEKERLKHIAAKEKAVNLALDIPPDDRLRNLIDQNFIREIWERTTAGNEIQAAAEEALRSSDPAVWKAFIDTGVIAAYQRDQAIWALKQDQEDRLAALQIRTRAQNSLVHPGVVAAATKAMAGSAKDVRDFLREGQYAALSQTILATSPGSTGKRLENVNTLANITAAPVGTENQPAPGATWKIVPGLANPACHSLESTTSPGYFLRHKDFRIKLMPTDGSPEFMNAATWCARPGASGSGATFESYDQRGRFMRHYLGELWLAEAGGTHPYDTTLRFSADSTWWIAPPQGSPLRSQPRAEALPGYRQLPSVATGRCVTAAVLSDCTASNTTTQSWQPETTTAGFVRIRNQSPGQCLATSGDTVVAAACVSVPGQNWKIVDQLSDTGGYRYSTFANEASGRCLTAEVNALAQRDCADRADQRWYLPEN